MSLFLATLGQIPILLDKRHTDEIIWERARGAGSHQGGVSHRSLNSNPITDLYF